MQTYVIAPHPSGSNRVRYAAVAPADRQALQRYVDTLQAIHISTYNRPQQQAFWINLYTAFTVRVVLEHYPVESIRDIDLSIGLFGSLFNKGPWDARLLTIEGEKVSLNDALGKKFRRIKLYCSARDFALDTCGHFKREMRWYICVAEALRLTTLEEP